MSRAVLVVVAVVMCFQMHSAAQNKPLALTGNITSLDGLWIHDPTKGISGSCGNTIDQTIRIRISEQGVRFESRRLAGLFSLDGSPTTMTGLGNFNGVASAALDAGWLAITTRRVRRAGGTNVQLDVFIVRDDELTIWRTFNVELPDGSMSQNVCGNRQALVYQRQRQP